MSKMLVDNINFLRRNYPQIREIMKQNEIILKNQPVEIIETKTGLPTLQVTHHQRPLFIHSKYDPMKEADRLVEQYERDMEKYDHIFFYGIGFGYHVEKFLEKYPEMKFTMYEPSPAVFYQYMKNRNITELPVKKLQNLFVEWNEELGSQFLEQFSLNTNDNVLLVTLPSYTRAFPIQHEQFITQFKNKIQKKGMNVAANVVYSKRWTLNSLMNLPTTLTTPNILVDKKHIFENKPVLLVAAGPSLADEYDNLRYIKENGLAYIFAVGSANRALIANDILPDAVLTYDPQAHNYTVFRPMYENHIDNVPMIYGTSVGYETLEYYQGPKLHFITSQDTITPYFAKNTITQSDIIDDAFSIAIVTLQLLLKMNAGPIILVGQNFAFRDNLFYSKDIKRGNKSAEVQEKDIEKSLYVQDVYGNQIKTNESFNQMRLAMEQWIQAAGNVEIMNTTKGGAAIQGAPFTPLEEIIETKLKTKVVDPNWYVNEGENIHYDVARKKQFLKAMENFIPNYEQAFKVLSQLQQQIEKKNVGKIEDSFAKFDKQFNKFLNAPFYISVIQPIVRMQFEKLQNDIRELNKTITVIEKGQQLVRAGNLFLLATIQAYNAISPFVYEVLNGIVSDDKKYKNDCGVFTYLGDWKKETLKIEEDKTITSLNYHIVDKKGAKITFNFVGTSIQILASTRKDFANKIEIKLDGQTTITSTKSNRATEFIFAKDQPIFERNNLKNELHEIEITLLEDKPFIFNGVKINQEGRVYHNHEVTTVEELEIGKRIRCHYKASLNRVGEFSGLGEETKIFIPPESSAFPDGDFYFIMVDETEEEGKKLIADRNVQHSISWDALDKAQITKGINIVLSGKEMFVRLLDGGQAFIDVNEKLALTNHKLGAWPKENEWDRYINEDFNWKYVGSWCNNEPVYGLQNIFYNGSLGDIMSEEVSGKVLRGNVYKRFFGVRKPHHIKKENGFRPVLILY